MAAVLTRLFKPFNLNEEIVSHRPTLETASEYYGAFGGFAARDILAGGLYGNLIAHADAILRNEMFRVTN